MRMLGLLLVFIALTVGMGHLYWLSLPDTERAALNARYLAKKQEQELRNRQACEEANAQFHIALDCTRSLSILGH